MMAAEAAVDKGNSELKSDGADVMQKVSTPSRQEGRRTAGGIVPTIQLILYITLCLGLSVTVMNITFIRYINKNSLESEAARADTSSSCVPS